MSWQPQIVMANVIFIECSHGGFIFQTMFFGSLMPMFSAPTTAVYVFYLALLWDVKSTSCKKKLE